MKTDSTANILHDTSFFFFQSRSELESTGLNGGMLAETFLGMCTAAGPVDKI